MYLYIAGCVSVGSSNSLCPRRRKLQGKDDDHQTTFSDHVLQPEQVDEYVLVELGAILHGELTGPNNILWVVAIDVDHGAVDDLGNVTETQ